ncbi:unnamed protein product [Clonostachys rhizophaga]|uniref:Uncharacterized protein n=1 Tax=Clonostachys rhizophaga TaxID=160324 RepID=A0A9N9YF27_9HYPO|nr:unnamed protein product [Clonostachys rhizophaga]
MPGVPKSCAVCQARKPPRSVIEGFPHALNASNTNGTAMDTRQRGRKTRDLGMMGHKVRKAVAYHLPEQSFRLDWDE